MANFPFTWFNLSDGAIGELNATIDATQTSFASKAGHGIKFPSSDFVFKIENEVIHCATRSTDTFSSLTRGYDGSAAAAHSVNSSLFLTAGRSLFQRMYDNLIGHTHPKADIPDFSHNHAQGDVTNLVSDLASKQATSEKGAVNGYASLDGTGKVPSAQLPAGGSDPFLFKGALAADAATGANTTPISLSGLVFTFVPNGRYIIDIIGATRAAAATTGGGFHLDTSVAVTRQGMSHVNQLANTGTLTGGSSIADDASVGVSSGRPSINTDTPVSGTGYLIAGANGGTAQLRYRSEVAAVSTVMAGFMMRVMPVP
jgi:hypothetical protein